MTQAREVYSAGAEVIRESLPHRNISTTPKRWRGAGWLSTRLLKTAGIAKAADLPALDPAMQEMVLEAYFGGRFEISRTGYIGEPVYEYDINSAHPAAMPQLPCPLHTQWRQVKRPNPGKLYIADIPSAIPKTLYGAGCLFARKTITYTVLGTVPVLIGQSRSRQRKSLVRRSHIVRCGRLRSVATATLTIGFPHSTNTAKPSALAADR